MNAEQVVDKILSEANAKAETIVSEAKAKADQQGAEREKEIKDLDAQTDQLAKEAADDKLRRMLATARMANAKQLLAAKGELLDAVFEKAKNAVDRLPDDQYLSLVTKLIKQAVETGDEEVIVGKNEQRITASFISKLNKELGSGFKGNLRLSDRRADISGGFILSRGKVQINAGTDVLIDSLRAEMETDLAQTLFENNQSNP